MSPTPTFINYNLVINLHLYFVAGFKGKKCEKLTSIGFREKDSYSRLATPTSRTALNVTIVMATRQKEGVILYYGAYSQHAAA